MSKTCNDCKFFTDTGINPNDPANHIYTCYRFPPVPVAIQGPQGAAMIPLRPSISSLDKACGEFKQKVKNAS